MTIDMDVVRQQMAGSSLSKAKNPFGKTPPPDNEAALMDACKGFEAIFMKKMVESMRDTLPGDALFSKSNTMDIFQSMHDQYLTDKLSQAPEGSGVKEFLYRQLKKSL